MSSLPRGHAKVLGFSNFSVLLPTYVQVLTIDLKCLSDIQIPNYSLTSLLSPAIHWQHHGCPMKLSQE